MDLRTIGLLVTGLILLAIITAFIFSAKFRKDVIASEGEAAVLGLINVKGVIIVLLTGIFGGIFAYIISLEPAEVTVEDMNSSQALDYMKKARDIDYEVRQGADSIRIFANGAAIGAIPNPPPQKLQTSRNKEQIRNWDVGPSLDAVVGYVNMSSDEGYLRRDSIHTTFDVGEPYKLKNLDLYFRIDSIKHFERTRTKYRYYVRFGEDKDGQGPKWRSKAEEFYKTPSGKIYLEEEFRVLQDADWESDYLLKMGVGQPLPISTPTNFQYVEVLNVEAVELKID